MKCRENPGGNLYSGFGLAAVLGAWLAATAGAQPATTLDADMQREYAQAGRVGGSVGLARTENQLQVKDGVAAYVSKDSVFIQPLRVACTLPICGAVCAAQAVRTIAYPLSTGMDTLPPLGLLRAEYPGSGAFTAVLAMALPGDRVDRIEVQVAADGTVRFQSGNPLALSGNPGIRAFVDLPSTAGDTGSAFLALGREGTLRRIETTSLGLAEAVLVSGTSDDFISQGEGWIGTAQGRIWRFRSGYAAPYLEAVPTPVPGQAIVRIDAYIARLGPDRYLLNRGTHWTGPQPEVAGLIGVSPRWKSGGTWLELWLEQGSRSLEFGQAAETVRYRRAGGAWMSDSVEPPSYPGTGTWVYEISLRDPDRNLTGTRIAFGHGDIASLRSNFGVAADPEAGCAATGWCLPGDETVMTLTFKPDSLSLSFPILEGRREVPPPCNTPVFIGERKQMTISEPWKPGDWIAFVRANTGSLAGTYVDFSYGSAGGTGPGARPGVRAPARIGLGIRPAWEAKPGVSVDAGGRRIKERAAAGAPRPARK